MTCESSSSFVAPPALEILRYAGAFNRIGGVLVSERIVLSNGIVVTMNDANEVHFGGSVVIESIFVYNGIGKRLIDAINQRDYPVMQGVFIVITISVIFANLMADLLYSRLDPRIRVGGGQSK